VAETRKLRDFAVAAGATVDGDQIVFDDEWQLEKCMSLAVQSTFEVIGEMNREQRDRADVLLDRWRERFGSRYERLGREDHYAEGVALHLTGVNRRQRRTDLGKEQREEIEEQMRIVRADQGS
jgi:hypothetical protein